MKEFIAEELDCKYRWNKEYGTLEYAPKLQDGTYDEYNSVDEDIVGTEPVTFMNKLMTFTDVYRIVERELGILKLDKNIKSLGDYYLSKAIEQYAKDFEIDEDKLYILAHKRMLDLFTELTDEL